MTVTADGLFVYGRLRSGGSQHVWIQRTLPAGDTSAHVAGRLFHLPEAGFPALVVAPEPAEAPPGPGWVVGEFIGYDDEQALEDAVQDLDSVKDVDGGLFERRVIPVRLDSGHRYLAYVYLFPEDRLVRLEREAIHLPNGDWQPYL